VGFFSIRCLACHVALIFTGMLVWPSNGLRLSRAAPQEHSQTQFYLQKTTAPAPAAC